MVAFVSLAIVNVLASLGVATACWSGANDCVKREELKKNPWHEFKKALVFAGSSSGVVIAATAILSNLGHSDLAAGILLASAAAQVGAAIAIKNAGCA